MGFEIRAEPFGTPLTQGMADAQQAELTERHHGSPGSGAMPDPAYFAPPDGAFLVAFEDGEPIACGGVGRWDDETAIKVVDGTVDVVSEGHWKLLIAPRD